jgi:hypothetical protein
MAPPSSSSSGDQHRPPITRGDSVSRRVLEDVLKQTASLYSFEPPTDPADLAVLREVAARLRGAPFALDPVVVELVRALLRRQLASLWSSEDQLNGVAAQIATTLFENPETNERLEKLWTRLTGEVQ